MKRIFALKRQPAVLDAADEQRRKQLFLLADRLLAPIARLFLRHNVLVPELERILRWNSMHIAFRDPAFAIDHREDAHKQTYSHAAIVTGLSRQEVAQAVQLESAPLDPSGGDVHRLVRVLAAWQTEPGYQDADGRPIELFLRGADPSFHQLCRRHGRDTPTRPIADAIVRNGNAEWVGRSEGNITGKKLRFLHPVVTAPFEAAADIGSLTQIAGDFAHALDQGLDPGAQQRPHFAMTSCDIDPCRADEALAFLRRELQAFRRRCEQGLEKFRAPQGVSGIRTGIGACSFHGSPALRNVPGAAASDGD